MLARVALAMAVLMALLAADASAFDATIRRTAHDVPHIRSKTWGGLGYGYGYAFAQDNICTIADSYMTVRAQRSRFLGPDKSWSFRGNGTTVNNLNSDFFFQRIIDRHTVEGLLTKPVPDGPRPEIRAVVRGYVAGYNRYLQRTGVDKLPDPTCRGAAWVTPITEIDVYRRFYQLALLASQGVAIDGIGGAAPPTPPLEGVTAGAPGQASMLAELKARLPLGGVGSNAVALGSKQTDSGRGMLLGNPHFPWDGSERFYQSQLTIPGKINVAGASLFGVPLILIGHTSSLAWSHTVSTAFRFTPFELKLVPGSPTSYVYDGEVRQMDADQVTVMAQGAGGGLEPRTRTLYSTLQGPVFTSILGLPLFPWTPAQAYAMGDANAANFRYLNHFLETDMAQSTTQLDAVLRRNQGIPWVNTIAADRAGRAYYADISVTPNVPDEKASRCTTGALGVATRQLLGLPVLDGTTSTCAWDNDPDARQPGIFGPKHMPSLVRDDFVTNSNDSFWLANPHQPLEGYARIIGAERTARSLRTRSGLKMVDGTHFTLRSLQDMVFSDQQYAGQLVRDDTVAMCREMIGLVPAEACDALAKWNVTDNLDDRGALLFRRFWSRASSSEALWRTPFSADDPVNTPRDLNTSAPDVRQALVDAVSDVTGLGAPLDTPLRGFQYEQRGDEKVAIHGGPGTLGVFNAINVTWVPGKGYPDVPHGSSFVMVVRFTKKGCPQGRSILTYSQSANPASPYFADQTRMFSNKEWNGMPFCAAEIKHDQVGRTKRLRGR